MSKIELFPISPNAAFSSPPNIGQTPCILDKLAQLRFSPEKPPPESKRLVGSEVLKKRAKAKWFTLAYLKHLIDLDSPLRNSYIRTVYCCDQLHQKDGKITSRYCNNRWCVVCNRIRIARAINGYMPELRKLEAPQFVTTTIPNVQKGDLRAAIAAMVHSWRLISERCRQRKINLVGVRKIECTYNPVYDNYHPHFHLIVDGKEIGEAIIQEWLLRWPAANLGGQDIRPADQGSMLEMFKYFTKVITKQRLYIPALDVMFQAMVGRRVFQPFGITRVSEEVDQLQAETFAGIEADEVFWTWMNSDWVNSDTGQLLTGYVPDEKLIRLVQGVILQ